jgi:hypothetical protein
MKALHSVLFQARQHRYPQDPPPALLFLNYRQGHELPNTESIDDLPEAFAI